MSLNIETSLHQTKRRLLQLEKKYGRSLGSVQLLLASKAQSADRIRDAYCAGQRVFGENYVQEALSKQAILRDCGIEWHFIGSIQLNKTRMIAECFDWAHTVDRFEAAKRLSLQRPLSFLPLNVCIQVNIDRELSKSGISPEQAIDLALRISTLNRLSLRGLMVVPKYQPDFEAQKVSFDRVLFLQQQLVDQGFALDTLCMGMSRDFEAAIAAGSTMVRLGTAVLGKR